jgi:hypothetical protein
MLTASLACSNACASPAPSWAWRMPETCSCRHSLPPRHSAAAAGTADCPLRWSVRAGSWTSAVCQGVPKAKANMTRVVRQKRGEAPPYLTSTFTQLRPTIIICFPYPCEMSDDTRSVHMQPRVCAAGTVRIMRAGRGCTSISRSPQKTSCSFMRSVDTLPISPASFPTPFPSHPPT